MTFEDAVCHFDPTLRRRANALAARVGIIEADDLMQETWLTAWRQWSWVTAVGDSVVRVRLFHILGQRFSAMLKFLSAQRRSGTLVEPELFAVDNPHAVVVARQTFRAVDALPRNWRDALMAIAAGFTLDERAETEGVSFQAVQQRVNKARDRLVAAGHGA